MKTFLALFFLLTASAEAMQSKIVQGPIPSSYSTTNTKSMVMSEVGQARNISIYNGTTDTVYCWPNAPSYKAVPVHYGNRTTSEEIVLPTLIGQSFDLAGVGPNIFCKSQTGSNTGVLTIHVW